MAVFLWVLAVCIVLLWLFLRPGRYGEAQKQLVYGVNHAHRGLHTKDKTVPENSLPAFRAAAEAGYGVELDIQLSRDGQVVVFHDDTLDRVCGVHGRVGRIYIRGAARDASVRHTGDDPPADGGV